MRMTIGSSGKLIKRWRCGAAGAGAGPHKSLSDGRCRTRKKSSHFHGCLRSKLKAASGGHNFLLAFGIVFLYLHPPKAHRSVAFCGWIVHAWYGGKKERSNSTDNNSLSGCFQLAALLPTVLQRESARAHYSSIFLGCMQKRNINQSKAKEKHIDANVTSLWQNGAVFRFQTRDCRITVQHCTILFLFGKNCSNID
jgi:hypothetical protein